MEDMAAYYLQHQPSGLFTYQYYQHPLLHRHWRRWWRWYRHPLERLTRRHHRHPLERLTRRRTTCIRNMSLATSSNQCLLHTAPQFLLNPPEDVKPRENYNIFREFPGYESSHL